MGTKKRILIVLILVAIAAAVFVNRDLLLKPREDGNMLKVSGNVEITEVEISFKIPGHVEKRLVSGIVLSENVEAGEYVVPGTPVITVGDLEKTWLRALSMNPIWEGSRSPEGASLHRHLSKQDI